VELYHSTSPVLEAANLFLQVYGFLPGQRYEYLSGESTSLSSALFYNVNSDLWEPAGTLMPRGLFKAEATDYYLLSSTGDPWTAKIYPPYVLVRVPQGATSATFEIQTL